MLNLTKKAWPLYSELRNFISTCLAVSSQSTLIISLCNTYLLNHAPSPSLLIQRWALTLSAFNYDIRYKPGKDISNADVLSRLPLPEFPATVPLPGETIFLIDTLESTPVNAARIKNWTNNDAVLTKVRDLVQQGWTNTNEEQLQPYQRRRDELSVHAGCVMLGNQVVIPLAGRNQIIEQLHQSHPGSTRMKGLG